MRKKNFLFAALFLAALVFGFSACENPNGDLLNNGDNNSGNTKPTTLEAPTLVATGGATDVAYSSVTLWGRINTDTLWAFPNIKWGIECSTSKEEMQSHKGKKALCTTDLVGKNSDEYTVAFTGLEGGKMLYYNAYLLINDMKYIYGEVDSVHLDVRLTVNSSNSSFGTVTGSGTYDHLAEATLTATPKPHYMFVKWSDENTDNPRTIIVNEDVTYTAIFAGAKGNENGHEWVDLGLSVKWATCNVGATSPEEYGNYYAWGETEPKTTYSWATYKWCNGSYNTQNKYCTSSTYGTVDNKTVLELADDAARANWGGQWRMPTDEEWTELRENCTWTWTTKNGVNGYEVKGTNGNSIFLPAAGYRGNDDLYGVGGDGSCWSSSLVTGNPSDACCVNFYSDDVYGSSRSRGYGRSVRPVL